MPLWNLWSHDTFLLFSNFSLSFPLFPDHETPELKPLIASYFDGYIFMGLSFHGVISCYLGMDQYLWKYHIFSGLFTSINPSYDLGFTARYQGFDPSPFFKARPELVLSTTVMNISQDVQPDDNFEAKHGRWTWTDRCRALGFLGIHEKHGETYGLTHGETWETWWNMVKHGETWWNMRNIYIWYYMVYNGRLLLTHLVGMKCDETWWNPKKICLFWPWLLSNY
jgi:hypothetical protein